MDETTNKFGGLDFRSDEWGVDFGSGK